MRRPHIFLDCDGVMADFDLGFFNLFGMTTKEADEKYSDAVFWSMIREAGTFFRDLPLMPDARELYEGVKHLNPTILTGIPRGDWSRQQKIDWAAEHFPGVPIITCPSVEKKLHGKPGDVLIDDLAKYRHHWISMGGVFITHHCAKTSLQTLWAHYPDLKV